MAIMDFWRKPYERMSEDPITRERIEGFLYNPQTGRRVDYSFNPMGEMISHTMPRKHGDGARDSFNRFRSRTLKISHRDFEALCDLMTSHLNEYDEKSKGYATRSERYAELIKDQGLIADTTKILTTLSGLVY